LDRTQSGYLLVEAYAADQICETRVVANGIEVRMDFEKLQDGGLLLEGALQPDEGLLVVSKPQVSVDKGAGWHVPGLTAPLEFRKEPERVSSPAGMSVTANQYADDGGASIGETHRLFERRDGVCGLAVGNQRVAEKPVCPGVVRLHRQNAAQDLDRLAIVTRVEQEQAIRYEPPHAKGIDCAGLLGPGNCLFEASLTEQPGCEAAISRGIIGLEVECPLEFRFGFLPPPIPLIGVSKEHMRFGKLGVELQSLLYGADQLGASLAGLNAAVDGAQVLVGAGHPEIRGCKGRVFVDGSLEEGDALL